MITATMGRRAMRRLYEETARESARLAEALQGTDDPGRRSNLLRERATHESTLAELYGAAYDPSPVVTEELRASAGLFRLVAATEAALVAATRAPAEAQNAVLAVVDLARDAGAGFAEARTWRELAVTANRSDRAALLVTLSDLAADRVGEQAAEVLYDLSRTEDALVNQAAGLPVERHTVAYAPSRWPVACAIAAVGAAVEVPGMVAMPAPLELLLLVALAWPVAVLVTAERVSQRHLAAIRTALAAAFALVGALLMLAQ